MRFVRLSLAGLVFVCMAGVVWAQEAAPRAVPQPRCERRIAATIDALDQPLMLNRLGTAYPQGMIFALDSDVVPREGTTKSAGNVLLRPGKRPRPIVLRMNAGDCLEITFNNYLTPVRNSYFQPVTRAASVHVAGLNVVRSIAEDGSFVGANPSSLVEPGATGRYTVYGNKPGTFLLYSAGAILGASAELGQLMAGLFGAVHVQPRRAEYYRSQVTATELELASRKAPQFGPPLIRYDARYPADYPDATRRCLPVLRMLDVPQRPAGGRCEAVTGAPMQLFHSDLTAIITGPNAGSFPPADPAPEFDAIPPGPPALRGVTSPDRRKPWREFTILYHEVANVVQAFKEFYQPDQLYDGGFAPPDLSEVLTNGADNLAINYGTGGIAAEIVASRIGVGPMGPCVDCKFEEFFLSAWSVGDPAMNVDTPANAPVSPADLELCQVLQSQSNPPTCPGYSSLNPAPGPKAKLAYFPDDPSNVYHSYLNDHVKFHILNAGSNASHIHHQHAHQWLHTPNDPNSSYLDSQLLGPAAGYTLEIDYGGSGNRNRTVGDSIFHCHFYPHFAGGMWAMWRVHDVFESGTPLNRDGSVPPKVRALPDGEIANGTPIPAIVPMPAYGMPPLPAKVEIVPVCKPNIPNCSPTDQSQWAGTEAKVVDEPGNPNPNPGFPFFIPGIAGHRAPHPPYDFACEQLPDGKCRTGPDGQIVYLDGGLQRHVVLDGTFSNQKLNQWDFSRDNATLAVRLLPERPGPRDVETRAINFFSRYEHASYMPDGTRAPYFTNGLPRGPQPGAPFADPAVVDGRAVGAGPRTYKAAVLQLNVVFNKAGWHYPQQRLITLWGDVQDTFKGTRPPEPFFFRANSDDIIEFWHTNLVPGYYELDDFQVRTPTDVIGQHIHLVKFDVTSSDGAGNGFNYEDGTFSPDEVRSRISAINAYNQCPRPGAYCPTVKAPPPQLGPAPPGQDWNGAQTTIQRWWADPLQGCLNALQGCGGDKDGDRTVRTVFTHDHFGPSTHQQIGLYAGLLVEPQRSEWLDQVTGAKMGGRYDGGPTSWMANIITPNKRDSFREFALEFGDNSLAYYAGSRATPGPYDPNYKQPLTSGSTPWGWADCANAINGPMRGNCKTSGTGSGALLAQPGVITAQQGIGTMTVNYRNEPLPLRFYAPSTGGAPNADPNATDLSHIYRSIVRNYPPMNTQPSGPGMGGFPGAGPTDPYTPLLRAYEGDNVQVRVLVGSNLFQHDFVMQGLRWLFEPSSPSSGHRSHQTMGISEHYEFAFKVPVRPASSTNATADYLYAPGAGTLDQVQGMWGMLRAFRPGATPSPALQTLPNNLLRNVPPGDICPPRAKTVKFNVAAIDSTKIPNGNITYNDRVAGSPIQVQYGPLMWAQTSDIGKTPEPLILRANAGDCIEVTLQNQFVSTTPTFTANPQSYQVTGGTSPQSATANPSTTAGLSPQLVSYDVTTSNAANIGLNPVQTVAAGQSTPAPYRWYAGITDVDARGKRTWTPAEFGSANLMTSDPLLQQPQAMIGALIIEPFGARVTVDLDSKASAWVTYPGGSFREFVAIHQNGLNLCWPPPCTASNTSTTTNAVNYGSEPMWYRYNDSGSNGNVNFDQINVFNAFSNSLTVGGQQMGDPHTPIFTAPIGAPVRFRMLHPDGPGGFPDTIWVLHGHQWQEEPYNEGSTKLGFNRLSNVQGSRDGFGFGGAFDILTRAGGELGVPGDYLYLSFPAFEAPYGNWGVFRVSGPIVQRVRGASIPTQELPENDPSLIRFNKKRRSGNVAPAPRLPGDPDDDDQGGENPNP